MAPPPTDQHVQQLKHLTSAVQRLRSWVRSDPSRQSELADALVALTGERLTWRAYAEAAPEAQEAARLAGELLATSGPLGPYTPRSDAIRYVTAAVHVAMVQAGMGLAASAGRTMDAAGPLLDRPDLEVAAGLDLPTVLWAAVATARGALAADEARAANTQADMAWRRLLAERAESDPAQGYLALDVHQLVADCRWFAGWGVDAVSFGELAREAYERVVDGRLVEPARLSPAALTRLSQPLPSVYGDLADRLVGTGDLDLGLQVRRELVDQLTNLGPRLPDQAAHLARARSDLASDLRRAGRPDEAADLAVEDLPDDDYARRTTLPAKVPLDQAPLPAAPQFREDRRLEAGRREAERRARYRAEAARRAEQERAAARLAAEREETDRAQAALQRAEAERQEAARQAAEAEAARVDRKRRREQRLEEHRREVERQEAERTERLIRELGSRKPKG